MPEWNSLVCASISCLDNATEGFYPGLLASSLAPSTLPNIQWQPLTYWLHHSNGPKRRNSVCQDVIFCTTPHVRWLESPSLPKLWQIQQSSVPFIIPVDSCFIPTSITQVENVALCKMLLPIFTVTRHLKIFSIHCNHKACEFEVSAKKIFHWLFSFMILLWFWYTVGYVFFFYGFFMRVKEPLNLIWICMIFLWF